MNLSAHIRIFAAEQCFLVELADRRCDINDLAEFPMRFQIHTPLVLARATIVVGGQIRAETRDSAQEEDNIKIEVLESFWICRNTVDEALEVWSLQSKGSV